MAKFFVGQRVQVKWVARPENLHITGKEGRIDLVLQTPDGARYGLDTHPIRHEIGDGGVFITYGFVADQLEPILHEGQQPCGETYEQLMDRLRSGVVA